MVRIGTVLHGYCEGHFGRDALGPKRVEAIGADWIVARMVNGHIVTAEFSYLPDGPAQMEKCLSEWEKVPLEPG